MLVFSRAERYLILTFLTFGLLYADLSYYKKITPAPEIRTINIKEKSISININIATSVELQRLPGIGPILAEDIVLYRQKNGGFKNPEELKNVKGIGDKKFERMKDLVSISE